MSDGADLFFGYQDGELILASKGSETGSVTFAPTKINSTSPGGVYIGNYAEWAHINYANTSASSGAAFTISHGGSAGAGTVGDQELIIRRNDNSSTTDNTIGSFVNAGLFVGPWNGQIIATFDPSYGSSLNGVAFTMSGAGTITNSSTGNESAMEGGNYSLSYVFNGGTYVAYRIFNGGSPVTYASLGGSTPAEGLVAQTTAFATTVVSSGVTEYEYKLTLPEQSETLQLQANSSTIVEYTSDRVNIQDDVFLNLPSASNTTILAYTNMSNGDMVYNSTDSYCGSVCWWCVAELAV